MMRSISRSKVMGVVMMSWACRGTQTTSSAARRDSNLISAPRYRLMPRNVKRLRYTRMLAGGAREIYTDDQVAGGTDGRLGNCGGSGPAGHRQETGGGGPRGLCSRDSRDLPALASQSPLYRCHHRTGHFLWT